MRATSRPKTRAPLHFTGIARGMLLAHSPSMSVFIYTCERCQEYFAGKPHRVLSEKDGEMLLDMMVCFGCYVEASQLGLETEPVEVRQGVLQ